MYIYIYIYMYMRVLYVYLRLSPAEEVCFYHNLVGGGRVGVDFLRDFWASYTHMYKAHTSKIRHCSTVSRSMDAEGCGFADIPLHPCNRLSVFPSVECRPRNFGSTAQLEQHGAEVVRDVGGGGRRTLRQTCIHTHMYIYIYIYIHM